MEPVIEEIRGDRIGQQTQDCPVCDGIMPAEAVTYGSWRLVVNRVRCYYRRTIAMHCPHCGTRRSRSQRIPLPVVA